MKTSHYTTPRSLDQCQFAHDADPIDYAVRGVHPKDKIVLWGSGIALAVLALLFAFKVI